MKNKQKYVAGGIQSPLRRSVWRLFMGTATHLPWKPLRDSSGPGALPGVFYHMIAETTPPHIAHLYTVRSPQLFRRDLETFARRFDIIGMEAVVKLASSGDPWPSNKLFISFDDGLSEAASIAAPILHQMGLPAIFYVCPPVLDNRRLLFRHKISLLCHLISANGEAAVCITRQLKERMGGTCDPIAKLLELSHRDEPLADELARVSGYDWADYLRQAKPYMDTADVAALRAMGFAIGAHTMTHPPFASISWSDQVEETRESLEAIGPWLDGSAPSFAFPFEDDGVDPRWFSHFLDSGHISFSVGTAGFVRDAHHRNIQRFCMDNNQTSAESLMRYACACRLFRSLIGKDRHHHGI